MATSHAFRKSLGTSQCEVVPRAAGFSVSGVGERQAQGLKTAVAVGLE